MWKEERSKLSEQHDLGSLLQIIAGNCVMLMKSKPWTIYSFSQGKKKKQLNRILQIQLREASAATEGIKYNTNGIKTGSSKNIDLLTVMRRHSRIQWNNKVQKHLCWSPLNHCYRCTKRKTISSKHHQASRNIG